MNHKITRTISALLFVALLFNAPRAQQATAVQQSSTDRIELYQALLDLQNPWTVMCVAAHPDDEDGTSLIVMRHKYGAHTVSLFSTFGEGGQNAIGPELYQELGAIRAGETMAAAEIQGSEPHFLRLKDFGFSKSPVETFEKWGHDEALRRMVLEIRKLRPDVIITNHSVTSNDHGHHRATARLVVEAFEAAADPQKFADQLKDGVTTWQVQRLFVRVRGNQAPAADAQIVTIDPNERDPVRGTVFAEQALEALQKHATQGPWPKSFAEFTARFRAFSGQGGGTGQMPMIRYRLEREAKSAGSLSKESHSFLDGLRLPDDIADRLAPPTIEGKPLGDFVGESRRVAEALIAAEKDKAYGESALALRAHAAAADVRVLRMNQELNNALAAALQVSVDFRSVQPVLLPGTHPEFGLTISNNGIRAVSFNGASIGDAPDLRILMAPATSANLPAGKTTTLRLPYTVPPNAEVTLPRSQHLYDGFADGKILTLTVLFRVDNAFFPLVVTRRFDVSPPVQILEVTPLPAILTPAVLPNGPRSNDRTKKVKFTVKLINRLTTPFSGKLVAASGLAHERTDQIPLTLAGSEIKTVTILAQQPPDLGPYNTVDFMIQTGNALSRSESAPVIWADAHVAQDLRVGYIRGFDFSLPHALAALGVESKELTVDEVKSAELSKYTSIIVDNRVYESQPELIAANQKLLDYANAGGTLIVFYHKSDEWNPDPRRNRPQLAPYKLILGNERITDENAPITFLEPDHPLLNAPNKLNQDDFKDWIQERGLYYPREWDPQFHALLQSNDPGEAPLKGGLLVADYGKGHYIYTSMVWYRELRGGIPGAYRMLANMISYGQR